MRFRAERPPFERLTDLAPNAAEGFLCLARGRVRTTLFAEPFVGSVSKRPTDL